MKASIYFFLLVILMSFYPKRTIAQEDSVTIGFILANLFIERWQKEKVFFENRVKELGGKVIFRDCYDQTDNQISAAKELIKENVDALVVIPVDAIAAAPIVNFAADANIPVIAYDRLIMHAPLDCYITYNSVHVGEIMAEAVINKIDQGSILYVGGPSDDHNSVFIRQGVFNILNHDKDKYSIYSTQVSSWTELDAYLVIQDYLSNNKIFPDAIICAADILTRGAIEVLKEYDKLGSVILTGQDAELDICRFIDEDWVEITIYKPGKKLANRTAEELWKILNNENYAPERTTNNGKMDVPTILLEPLSVTRETIISTVIEDKYYKKEEVFGQ